MSKRATEVFALETLEEVLNAEPDTLRYNGEVFTKRWMVTFMLDLVGYSSGSELAQLRVLEPACGDGAFLEVIVERLLASYRRRRQANIDLGAAIRAYDIVPENIIACRKRLGAILLKHGILDPDLLLNQWVHCEDYLLQEEQSDFNLVIGNPPYINAQALDERKRKQYLNTCSTMTMGSDVFIGFIEKGLEALAPNGKLCFIVADRWQHNKYGRGLRHMIVNGYSVKAMLEMHGVRAFEEPVDAYPAVTVIARGDQGSVKMAQAEREFDENAALRLGAWLASPAPPTLSDPLFNAAVLPGWFTTDDIWPSGNPNTLAFLEGLEQRFPLLEDPRTGTRLGIGIATGADAVFITTDPELVEKERLLPLATTKTNKPNSQSIPEYLVNPWDERGELVELDSYPRLADYFDRHKDRLCARSVARRDVKRWYATIDKVRPGLCQRPKLLLSDMGRAIAPVYDVDRYPHHNLYWITSERWDVEVLGGILLSEVAELFVDAYCVKMRNGTMRFQAQYLRKIRVPEVEALSNEVKEQLRSAFKSRNRAAATAAALNAYGLNEMPRK